MVSTSQTFSISNISPTSAISQTLKRKREEPGCKKQARQKAHDAVLDSGDESPLSRAGLDLTKNKANVNAAAVQDVNDEMDLAQLAKQLTSKIEETRKQNDAKRLKMEERHMLEVLKLQRRIQSLEAELFEWETTMVKPDADDVKRKVCHAIDTVFQES
ncbi:hypothetical protein PVAG01_08784 [Phlyctema vagabunda]|uniref:Uncharacterized protein n=1 Tax=Phlyctema vagabunda TaxID=108571 RepID=A0ABR4PAH0_9HELO